jgi:hypothetical protein
MTFRVLSLLERRRPAEALERAGKLLQYASTRGDPRLAGLSRRAWSLEVQKELSKPVIKLQGDAFPPITHREPSHIDFTAL